MTLAKPSTSISRVSTIALKTTFPLPGSVGTVGMAFMYDDRLRIEVGVSESTTCSQATLTYAGVVRVALHRGRRA